MSTLQTTRREFLAGTGALVVGFSLVPEVLAQTAGRAKPVATDQVDSFLAIGRDGSVTMYTGKVDIGTGIRAALPQMVAEELDVALGRVTMVEGDTALTPDQGPTWGSLSVQVAGVQIRQAAATARKALTEMAVQKLGMPSADLAVKDGVIFVRAEPHRRVSYVELIGEKSFDLKLDPAAQLKNPKDYTIVGQPVPRPDIPGKVTGIHTYMQDFRVPGMLHARVVRPPAIGARLESVDEATVKGITGVRQVVRLENFLAVAAEPEWAAVKAARQLKATWSSWEGLPDGRSSARPCGPRPWPRTSRCQPGRPGAAIAGAAKKLSATYDSRSTPTARWALLRGGGVKDGKAGCGRPRRRRTGSGGSWQPCFRRDAKEIRILYLDGSGCYGRNGHEDGTADAALIAKLWASRCASSGRARTSTAGTRRARRRSWRSWRPSTRWATSSAGSPSSGFRRRT